jgi:exodeoxyribonuclease V alpha subunit
MHLTVRMAWHDSEWNGRVCNDPRGNTYCTGAHSLLSGRIEKKKNTELEEQKHGQVIRGNFDPSSVPPCFWSINAFGSAGFKVEHQHAFTKDEAPISTVSDQVKPYSVFTWPFKLSFVHGNEQKKKHGNYPPDLDTRIANFIKSFTPQQSIIFFYANYDNPVSADDMKYLLIGCSLLDKLPKPMHFPFSKDELAGWRSRGKRVNGGALTMKNFPSMNWALQFSHAPKSAVMLPYKLYIAYAEQHPEDEEKLQDMKVIIEEESLVRSFKYVAMDIDDDKSLYLLYKLRKALKKIQAHNRTVVDSDLSDQEARLEKLIALTWKSRGTYPSLAAVLSHFTDDAQTARNIATAIAKVCAPERDLLDVFRDITQGNVPSGLSRLKNDVLDLGEKRLFKRSIEGLARLCLFNLTPHQVNRIIDDPTLLKQVATNPYALYEEYVSDDDDLDAPQLMDEPIDLYKIDIGMIPDRKYVERHRKLQFLAEDSPERIRAVYINYLTRLGQQGHCYDHTGNMINEVKDNPLIYKNDKVSIDEGALTVLDSDYKAHFMEKLHIVRGEGADFYYLKEIKEAEQKVKVVVDQLLNRRDHNDKSFEIDKYVDRALQSDALRNVITTDRGKTLFGDERRQLYTHIFSKSVFLLTGKPGSGKTFETAAVIEHLQSIGEKVEVLAPTGKAVLRISEILRATAPTNTVAPLTIDKFLFDHFAEVMNGTRAVDSIAESEKLIVENLILDESSMIDLEKLNLLFSLMKVTPKLPKRLILVGDENQLPPIGYGKPFHDMITYVLSDQNRASKHYINIQSNCRQENDPNILALAEAFTDKRRYADLAIELLKNEGWVSSGLFINRWSDAATLSRAIDSAMTDLFSKELGSTSLGPVVGLNRLFGLYDNGNVNNQNYAFRRTLTLDRLQLLTPYRSGFFGTLGLNKAIQAGYRERPEYSDADSAFYHADKIIRLKNWYRGWGDDRTLVLSNGSIGICKGDGPSRQYYFSELDRPWSYVGDEEEYDLAYAISVHRSQGSDFRNVLLIIPRKSALLCKELIYTALTRSRFRLFLFIQESDDDILLQAKTTSHLLGRNTSIFLPPVDNTTKLLPDPHGKPVNSRIEYIIYQSLKRSGLKFDYEKTLPLAKRDYDIHPDFTIELPGGGTIYWEHLGMLDVRKYYKDWQRRIQDYKDHGLFDRVITTDDLEGINQAKIDAVIEAIRERQLRTDTGNRFSLHHYELY